VTAEAIPLLESDGWKTHDWFYHKDDKFRCCKKCGVIERHDKQNRMCKGRTRIKFREAEVVDDCLSDLAYSMQRGMIIDGKKC
jgi:hypothetical protein